MDFIFDILRSLMPPSPLQNGDRDLAERTQLYVKRTERWRWVVFTWLVTLVIVLAGDITLSHGLIPGFSDEGFVTRATFASSLAGSNGKLSQAQGQIKSIQVTLLEKTMLDTKINECRSTNKRYFAERLNQLRVEYRALVGFDWTEPNCEEVEGS